jgi:phosphate:Na+ symporter
VLVAGLLSAAVMQSSTVVSVMLVGFVSSGVMSFPQTLGVLLGTIGRAGRGGWRGSCSRRERRHAGVQIGCTVVTQIIAFSSMKLSLFLIAIGFALYSAARSARLSQYGSLVMGTGLLLYGNTLLGTAMRMLRDYEPFISLMASIDHPVLVRAAADAYHACFFVSLALTAGSSARGSRACWSERW